MKPFFGRRIFAAAILVCCLMVTTAYADVTQQDIDDAKNKIDELQDDQEEAQEKVDDITEQKNDIQEDLDSLNGQMSNIVSSLNALETQIKDKQKEISDLEDEIEATKDELEAAKQRSEEQYEDMKVRIQYMYENGSASMLEVLLSADSFTEFLNRTEYASDINSYDRDKLDEYVKTQNEIAAKEAALLEDAAKLLEEEEELLAMQEDAKDKQSEIGTLLDTAQANMDQTNSDLAQAQDTVDDIAEQIAQMEEYEQQLEAQKAAEDAARMDEIKQQEAENGNTSFSYTASDNDVYLLAVIIHCEADGEPYEGKLAVGSVVLNRVKSSYFPDTIAGVIYQSGQFSPVSSGRYAYWLENWSNRSKNDTCTQAAQEVLSGNITTDALFFRTVKSAEGKGIEGTVIGNHIFY